MGSRTRQTRAVVSYKVDDSSDESDDDMPFTVPRSAKNDASRGEQEAGNGKGRKNLALKKNRSQDRGEARVAERVHPAHLEQTGVREELDVSPEIVQSDSVVGKLSSETKTTAFQHLVDVAFEATDAKIIDAYDPSGGAVEEGQQMQSLAAGGESAQQRKRSDSVQGDGREPKSAAEHTLHTGQEETGGIDTVRPLPEKSSENQKALSDDDDWLHEDVVNGDSSDSASDFSCEDASDSDLDMERSAKKRQTTNAAARKPPQSASRTSVTKGPRSKSSVADRKVSSSSMRRVESKNPPTKPVGRPRKESPKTVKPSGGSNRSLVQGTGAPACVPRLQPAKLRLKMASKEAMSDGSLCGPSGGVPAQLISPNNLPHRRVLGLSRRCRPPPLHPYLAGT